MPSTGGDVLSNADTRRPEMFSAVPRNSRLELNLEIEPGKEGWANLSDRQCPLLTVVETSETRRVGIGKMMEESSGSRSFCILLLKDAIFMSVIFCPPWAQQQLAPAHTNQAPR